MNPSEQTNPNQSEIKNLVFEIPEENLGRFKDKIDALIRRANKLGCVPPGYTIGTPFEKMITHYDPIWEEHEELVIVLYPVQVTGESPKFNGWTFLAACDYEEQDAPPIVKALEGAVIPDRYRNLGPLCEHCKKKRDRRETFLVHHEDGRTVQVGRSCMKDFLGHPNPEHLASVAEIFRELSECGGFQGYDLDQAKPTVRTFLGWVASVIRDYGWCSKADAYAVEDGGRVPTATRAETRMYEHIDAARKGKTAKFQPPSEEDKRKADSALDWAKNLGGDKRLSDYEQNVKAAAQRAYIGKNAGLIASIIPAHSRAIQVQAERAESAHVGEVGKRLRGLRLQVLRAIELPGMSLGYGRETQPVLHIMKDERGNSFTWKSSSKVLDEQAWYTMDVTVKDHSNYKGRNQTVLTRPAKIEQITYQPEGLENQAKAC